MEEDQKNIETEQYSVRWLFIIISGIVSALERFLGGGIGVVNNIYVAYFRLPYATIDWFTLIALPGKVTGNLVLVVIIYFQLVGLRRLFITLAACLVFYCAGLTIGYVFPILYSLIFIAQFVKGIVTVLVEVVAAMLCVIWFPENQVGFALSFKEIGGSTGSLLAYVVPSFALDPPPQNTSFIRNQMSGNISFSNSSLTGLFENDWRHNWISKDGFRLFLISLISFIIAVTILINLVIFSADAPPKPPSVAQASLRSNKNTTKIKFHSKNMAAFFQQCYRVAFSVVNIEVVIILAVLAGCTFIQKMLMGEILRDSYLKFFSPVKANELTGFALVLFEIGCVIGSILSGKVSDYFKNYVLQIASGMFLTFLSGLGIFLGYYFENFATVFVFQTSYGVFSALCVIPLYECLFQHFYPMNTGFIVLITGVQIDVVSTVVGEISRLVYINLSGGAVIIYMTILFFLSFVLALFLRPNYERLNTEFLKPSESDSSKSNEEKANTPLLNPDNRNGKASN